MHERVEILAGADTALQHFEQTREHLRVNVRHASLSTWSTQNTARRLAQALRRPCDVPNVLGQLADHAGCEHGPREIGGESGEEVVVEVDRLHLGGECIFSLEDILDERC